MFLNLARESEGNHLNFPIQNSWQRLEKLSIRVSKMNNISKPNNLMSFKCWIDFHPRLQLHSCHKFSTSVGSPLEEKRCKNSPTQIRTYWCQRKTFQRFCVVVVVSRQFPKFHRCLELSMKLFDQKFMKFKWKKYLNWLKDWWRAQNCFPKRFVHKPSLKSPNRLPCKNASENWKLKSRSLFSSTHVSKPSIRRESKNFKRP